MRVTIILAAVCVFVGSFSGADAFVGKIVQSTRQAAESAVNATQKVFNATVLTTSNAILSAQDLISSELQSAMNQFNKIDACTAEGYNVSCCAASFFNKSLCFNAGMDDWSFKVELTFNGIVLASKEMEGNALPPVCATLPPMPVFQICLNVYEVVVHDDGYHTCASVSARATVKDIAAVDLNCLRLRSNGDLSFVASESGSTSGLIYINASNYNPLMNQVFNGFDTARNVIRG